MDTKELMAVALEASRAAVEVHRAHTGRVRADEWSEKGVADYVTHVDEEAEERVVERILARYPDHSIVAEEGTARTTTGEPSARGTDTPSSEAITWIIDPLDGTTNFLHGYPVYAVSVAALSGATLLAGVVISGATGEEWSAHAGGGAFLDGERIHVSELDEMPKALIGTGFPFKARHLIPSYLPQFEAVLRSSSGVRRAGSAALDLCHVATGLFDGFWELDLEPWDYAAGALIVREAGGVVTGIDGDLDLEGGGSVLAGNPGIHRELSSLLDQVSGSSRTRS